MKFKQFEIRQDLAAFKVGTDSVLLGSWVNVGQSITILDIGTGTGILALMMAQRSCDGSAITAIDIDESAVKEARENADRSPWSDRIECIHASFQHFTGTETRKFDLIISNPPYFNTTTLTSDPALAQARNTIHLRFDDLIKGVVKTLSENGGFSLVLPVNEAMDFRKIAQRSGLRLVRLCRVYSLPDEKYEKRHLMTFQHANPVSHESVSEERIIIEEGERHHYSKAFKTLTRDFYLKF